MIIAVDPGQHTGLAFRLDNGQWATILADKVPDPDERLTMVLSCLRERMETGTCTALVIERFKTMGYLSKYGIETIELIGAIRALCMLFAVPVVKQDNFHRLPFERQAKALLKERSKTLDLPVSDHEISALAHLLRYEHIQETALAPGTPAPAPALNGGTMPLTIKPVGTRAQ